MKSRKRRYRQGTSKGDKTDSDIEKENDELRLCLTIISDEDKEVDYEILDKKCPIIEWKSEYHGIKLQFDETKDFSNPFTADSLLKTIWFSTHHASHNEALAIPEQTTTGKEISNPFMAGEDCWVLEDFTTYCCWFNIGAASEDLVLLRKIEENSLRIDKFVFPIDFIVLDMLEDIKTPLILERPFLSTIHAKIDVLKRKITLRVGDDKVVFKSDKPASNIIKRVYALSLTERMELDLEVRLMGEALMLNRSLDPLYGDYIELNDLNEPLKLRRNHHFVVVENMDSYCDKGIGDIIVGRPFCKDACIKARRFDGMITIYKGNDNTQGQIKVLPPRTAEEILAREIERKARTTLIMALPEDHLAKFHKMTDAKEMWEAIKSRFGGNDESKKMQKFQSLLSQLEIHGAGISTEDANQKFLRSLPSAWSQVSLIMRTKPRVDNLSFDDLYNNLRVFESNVKGSTASSSSTQNVAFVLKNTSSTNDVSTAYSVSNSSGHNSQSYFIILLTCKSI
ncbi:ribonuclease H-like domain-containing protein [Tanacetum coccineum]